MKTTRLLIIVATLFLWAPCVSATLINFEDLSDSDIVGNHYAALGVTFTNALLVSAGLSLNEAELPPHSGTNVALDLGPVTIQFATLVNSISAYFTYASPLLITAYDSTSTPVRTAVSLFNANLVSSGNPPNELIQIDYAPGIDHVTIAGDPGGLSFAMDDVSFSVGAVSGVPEPGSSLLVGAALALVTVAVSVRRSWFVSR